MLRNLPHSLDLTALDGRILVQGPRDHIRKLSENGTIVFTPTHLSNLDSVVFGFAIERAGFPPATYGAGKNLFTNPVLKITDFGLARWADDDPDRPISHLTQIGSVLGTPEFMSPEQTRNSSTCDIRADLYSLGCTFYYLLAGQVPFPNGTTPRTAQFSPPRMLGRRFRLIVSG